MSPVRGFILQASYRVITRKGGIRVPVVQIPVVQIPVVQIPVVQIYGRLENGWTFLVRACPRSHFYSAAGNFASSKKAPPTKRGGGDKAPPERPCPGGEI